ncbi:MAG: esterase [Bacteroidales bacterium]|nr:esterase [Bacteroidales bacterium]
MQLRAHRFVAAIMACTITSLSAFAQSMTPSREQMPEGSVAMETNINQHSYPRLMPDNSIIFRLRAPEAQKVQADICGVKYDMKRDDNGVWTGQTAPQVPGFHYYSLVVDGVSVNDPASETFYGCGRMMSAVDVPEKDLDYLTIKDIPHGKVSTLNYYSKVTGSWRTLCVYTPPTYDANSDKRYPVLYIQHGGGEDHRGWMQQGKTNIILDNLIAEGKAEEMIVVSANSNVNAGMGGYRWEGMQAFRAELVDNVIPFIDKTFRTVADREHRAMCGLSMGGGQTFYIGLRGLDVFSSVGIFSTGMFGGINGAAGTDLDKEVPGLLSDAASFNKKLEAFLITCGEQDPRIEHNKRVAAEMQSHGLKVKFESFPGDHEWQPWRKSLHSFAQMLFKAK